MRNYIILYINGQKKTIHGEKIYLSLSNYLRDELLLKGTKVVCEEGDCGACTVLKLSPKFNRTNEFNFVSINSCITYLYLLDCCHIITIEGVNNQIQQEFITNNSSQCGFCTPGFVMSMTSLAISTLKNSKEKNKGSQKLCEKQIRNELTGNLCRCTGYAQIIDAGLSLNLETLDIDKKYYNKTIIKDLLHHKNIPVQIKTNKTEFNSPTNLDGLLEYIQPETTFIASATDLGVQINKAHKEIKYTLSANLVSSFNQLEYFDNTIEIGAKVTLSRLQQFTKDKIPEFSKLLNIFASPQIKNTATLVGNIANASPIGDTIPFLMICEAVIEVTNKKNQKRQININQFYLGYKKLDLKEDEIITKVILPIPSQSIIFKLYKVSKRKDLDISTVSAAFYLELNLQKISKIKICYGGVGPTVIRLASLEKCFQGELLNQVTVDKIANEISNQIKPMSDVRGSATYRCLIAKNLFKKFYYDFLNNQKMGASL